MTTHRVRGEGIADHLAVVEAIARRRSVVRGDADWGRSVASWTVGPRDLTHWGRISTINAVLDGDELLGSVILVEHDMTVHPELSA